MVDSTHAAASACAAAMSELHAPTTAPARRLELQHVLHSERASATADPARRHVWRRVLTSSHDEMVLWFALSTCEGSLREPTVRGIPATERLELRAALGEMLLTYPLPASARGKGVAVLAQLARASWPKEAPALLPELLALLQASGMSRALGGRVLAAIADEFASADARLPTGGGAGAVGQADSREAAFLQFLPNAYAALAEALRAEAQGDDATADGGEDGGGLDVGAASVCLEAARALVGYGRGGSGPRDGGPRRAGARTFSPDEAAALPSLLEAACAFLRPRPGQGGRRAADESGGVGALRLLTEVVELQDPRAASLVGQLVSPLLALAQDLAAQPLPPWGLSEGAYEAYSDALAYALEALSRAWLVRVAPSAALPLLSSLWAHAVRVPLVRELRLCVALSTLVLESAAEQHGGPAAGGALADGLLSIAPEMVGRLLLTHSPLAAAEFADEVDDAWAADAGRVAADDSTDLVALWHAAADGADGGSLGGGGGGYGLDATGLGAGSAEAHEEGDDGEGLAGGLLPAASALLSTLAATHGARVVSLLAEQLSALLPHAVMAAPPHASSPPHLAPPTPPTPPLHASYDVATLSILLAATLPTAAAAVSDPLVELPIASLLQMLLAALGNEPPPPPRHPYACRVTLALLSPLNQLSLLLGAAYGNGPPAATSHSEAVGGALTSCVRAMITHAVGLLARDAGGGVACHAASALLVEITTRRCPLEVHAAGGLRQLASLGGGQLSRHALAAGIPLACWPRLFSSVACALIIPPRGHRPTAGAASAATLSPEHIGALHELIESLVAPMRAPTVACPNGGAVCAPGTPPSPPPTASADEAVAVGAPALCLCAMITAARDAPQEARAALDGALDAAGVHDVLQALLAQLLARAPPPFGALASIMRLLRALKRSIGSAGVWGSTAAVQWTLSAALQTTALAAAALPESTPAWTPHAVGAARAECEALLEAALDLVTTAVSARRGAMAADSAAALVGQVLDACGPQRFGSLLGASAVHAAGGGGGGRDEARAAAAAAPLLSPPLREKLLALAHALLTSQWKALRTAGDQQAMLAAVMQLVAAGLSHPSDAPAFRVALSCTSLLHERTAGGGAVGAAKAALMAANGGACGEAAHARPGWASGGLSDLGMQLRCLVLSARLDRAHAPLHDDTDGCLHAVLAAEAQLARASAVGDAGALGAEGGHASGGHFAACFHGVVERILHAESWMGGDAATRLLNGVRATDLGGDEPSFGRALARFANELNALRDEAAQTQLF